MASERKYEEKKISIFTALFLTTSYLAITFYGVLFLVSNEKSLRSSFYGRYGIGVFRLLSITTFMCSLYNLVLAVKRIVEFARDLYLCDFAHSVHRMLKWLKKSVYISLHLLYIIMEFGTSVALVISNWYLNKRWYIRLLVAVWTIVFVIDSISFILLMVSRIVVYTTNTELKLARRYMFVVSFILASIMKKKKE